MDTAKKMNDFNTALKRIRNSSAETMNEMAAQAAEGARDAAQALDRSARRSPWKYAGVAAVAAGAIGFFAGRRSKD